MPNAIFPPAPSRPTPRLEHASGLLLAALSLAVAAAQPAVGDATSNPHTPNPNSPTPIEPTSPPGRLIDGEPEVPQVRANFSLFGLYAPSADIHNNRGSVDTARGGGELGVDIPVAPGRFVSLSFSGEYSSYDFQDASGFPGDPSRGPWQDVTVLSVGVAYRAKIDEDWSYFLGLAGDASFERGADFNHSLTLSGVGGASYAWSKDLRVGFGLAAGSRLEDSIFALPILTLDWTPAEKWKLSTTTGLGNRSAGLTLSYEVTDAITLGLSGGFESREFRLDREGPIPDGVGRDYRLPLILTAKWKADPQVELTLAVGANLWGQLRAENSNGDRLSQEELSPGFLVGGGVQFRF